MRRQAGYSFLEVLIAMLVMGVAVLSFAALQVRALETTGVSHIRSQAMTLAAEFSERVRGNPTALASYRNPLLYNGPTVPSGTPVNWANTCTLLMNVNSNGCGPIQMAAFDVNEFEYLADQMLPGGLVRTATCGGDVDATCIFVSWAGTLPDACEDNASLNCVSMQVFVQ